MDLIQLLSQVLINAVLIIIMGINKYSKYYHSINECCSNHYILIMDINKNFKNYQKY